MMLLACGNAFGQENGETKLEPVQKYGYKDETGKMVINPQFDGVGHFSTGLAAVKVGENGATSTSPAKWSLIRNLTVPVPLVQEAPK